MSDFESNELKPDSSDRPNNTRHHNGSKMPNFGNSIAKLHISRQHMMMGIGAIVLLIIIVTITSSLKSSDDAVQVNNGNIELNTSTNTGPESGSGQMQQIQPQKIEISPADPRTTETPLQTANSNQQRVDNADSVIDDLAQEHTNTKPAPPAQSSLSNLPSGNVTLQLSGASQPNTLEAFAKKNRLNGYWIYETRREKKPWFVLIYGSYPNVHEANKAIGTLPADIQAKKPWVKPIRQAQKESKLR